MLSSLYEGFPNVVAESLACGTPVVSTDCPSGPADLLANGQYGRLTPVGDEIALAGAIHEALDSAPDRERLVSRARELAPAAIADRWLALLEGDDPSGLESVETAGR